MTETYTVIEIEEMDFGCEGLPEGEEYCAIVTLLSTMDNSTTKIKYPDAELYRKSIHIGDSVYFENNNIIKL